MQRSLLLPSLVWILLLTPGLRGQEEKGGGARVEMMAYDDAARGIHLEHPRNWTQQQATNASIAVIFVNTKTEAGQHFRDNVNLVINRAGGAGDIEKLTDGAKEQLKARLTAFHLISDSKVTLSGQPARKLVYSHKVQDLDMQVTQAFSIINDNIYTLTFTTLVERADKLAPAISAMIDSFKIDPDKAKPVEEPGDANKVPTEFAQYDDPQHRFSFKYPAGWQKRQSNNPGLAVSIADTQPHGGFTENMNVTYRQLPGDADIDEIVKATAAALAKQFTDFKVVENAKVDIDGRSGRKLVYTGTRGMPMKLTQIFVMDQRKFYTLTVGTSIERYEPMKAAIGQIVDSWKLEK